MAEASSGCVVEKYRSIDPEYVPLIVAELDHWTVLVSDNQNYLGRMVVWGLREGEMQRYSHLSVDELVELGIALRKTEAALHALFQPDHMNYAWLGNRFDLHGGHGHMHLIPRYIDARYYRLRPYHDKRWGLDYHVVGDRYVPPRETLLGLRDDMKRVFPR